MLHDFKRYQHEINIRGNGSFVALPKIETETGKKSFVHQGDSIFNRIEKIIRDDISILRFKKKVKHYKRKAVHNEPTGLHLNFHLSLMKKLLNFLSHSLFYDDFDLKDCY